MNIALSNKITIQKLQAIALEKNYKIFENDSKDYNLNIWNIRSSEKKSNTFNDICVIFWKYNEKWHIETYTITTDPGLFYLKKLINPLGTAILKPGQYLNSWSLGLHNGKYKALVQIKPITVIRDFDLDDELDFDCDLTDILQDKLYPKKNYYDNTLGQIFEIQNPAKKLIYRESTGLYGINFHHSGKTFISKSISNWSAGCQVHYNYEDYWQKFIPLLEASKSKWGDKFSLTLIEEKDIDKVGI